MTIPEVAHLFLVSLNTQPVRKPGILASVIALLEITAKRTELLQDLITHTGPHALPHSPPQCCFLPVSCPHRKLSLRAESEDEFVRSCRAKEKELESVPCHHASLEPEAWAGLDDLIRVAKDRILDEQKKTVWVEQDLL